MSASPTDPLLQDIAADRQAATTRQAALDTQRQASGKARETELAPLEAQSLAAISDLSSMKPPPKADLPTYQPKPVIDAGEYQKLSLGLIGMALIGGIASRGNWQGATTSLNGALQGYLEGNIDRAHQEYQDYQTKFKEAQAKSEAEQKEFAEILQNKRLSINDMLTRVKIAAAKYGRDDVRMEAEQKSIDGIWRRVEAMDTSIARIQDMDERQRKALDAALKRKEEAGAGFGGRIGQLMATAADLGVSLPAGFRSKEQQRALWQGLIDKHPNESDEDIIARVKSGQIEMAAERKETQTAAGIAGRVAVGENELLDFAPKALAISDKIARGNFVPFTRLVQMGEANISDPDLKELYGRTNAILNAYDVVAARGGTDKDKRAENRKNLETADGPRAYRRALETMMDEARIAKKAARKAEGIGEKSDAAPQAPAIGTIEDGHRFKGGNAGDPASWEVVNGQ